MDKSRKEIIQIIKYLALGLSVTALQFVLVNVFSLIFSSLRSPLPSFLRLIFNDKTMGEGNSNWGYVMTFFLSNLLANVYGYFINRKTVFHSDSPLWCFITFICVMAALILFSTWLQGVIANMVAQRYSSLKGLSNTIAAAFCGFFQNLIVFPLEKFVLLREKKS